MVFTQELTLLQGGRISQPMKYITAALVAVVLAILVNFIFVRLTAREVKPNQSELLDAGIGALGVGWAAKTLLRRTRHYVPHDSGGGGPPGSRGPWIRDLRPGLCGLCAVPARAPASSVFYIFRWRRNDGKT